MSFVEIEGNHALKGRLLRLVANKSIPQCSIFEGPVEHALKIAESFAQTVLCTDKKDDDACGVCNIYIQTTPLCRAKQKKSYV